MDKKRLVYFHAGEFFIVATSGILVILSYALEQNLLLIPVFILGVCYFAWFSAVKESIPESSQGVHRSNSIMVAVSSVVALYRPGALVLGIMLAFISICIVARIISKPGGHPMKKNLSWNLANNF